MLFFLVIEYRRLRIYFLAFSFAFVSFFLASSFRSLRGIIFIGLNRLGGGGNIPNFPNIHATRSDGCPPTLPNI